MVNPVEFEVRTRARRQFVDITPQVVEKVQASGVRSGVCVVYIRHTTAGVTVNENADPTVASDILRRLEVLAPDDAGYAHLEGNSPAHVMATLVGSSATIPVVDGRLALGRWQGVFLAEFDGPRTRKVSVTVVGT
ncbi:MAG TPA: hypothetical protein DHW14_07070 [Clostridiales bacterium]|nr:hypothetical protein [Clostridiales bacterium]